MSGGGGGVISEGGGVRLKSSPQVSTGDVCVCIRMCMDVYVFTPGCLCAYA